MTAQIGLRSLIEQRGEIHVVGETASLLAALPLVDRIDVLVIASHAPIPDPVLARLRDGDRAPAVLLVIDDKGQLTDYLTLDLPIWGVVSTESTGEELKAAVGALAAGLMVGEPHLVGPLLSSSPEPPPVTDLTPREQEVLDLLSAGFSNREIAAELEISEHTAKFHVSSVYTKLGANGRVEAVQIGLRKGLLTL